MCYVSRVMIQVLSSTEVESVLARRVSQQMCHRA
jgi:hypothetical protein